MSYERYITPTTKLYVVTRADLSPGQQACQAVHSVCQFAKEHREWWFDPWMEKSNHICLLQTANEGSLQELILKADQEQIPYSEFREPDLNNSLTSVTFAPYNWSADLCSHLKLMLPNT